jgi:hypothetical protein
MLGINLGLHEFVLPVLGVDLGLHLLVFFLKFSGAFEHLLDLLLGQAVTVGDRHIRLLSGALVLGGDVEDTYEVF